MIVEWMGKRSCACLSHCEFIGGVVNLSWLLCTECKHKESCLTERPGRLIGNIDMEE